MLCRSFRVDVRRRESGQRMPGTNYRPTARRDLAIYGGGQFRSSEAQQRKIRKSNRKPWQKTQRYGAWSAKRRGTASEQMYARCVINDGDDDDDDDGYYCRRRATAREGKVVEGRQQQQQLGGKTIGVARVDPRTFFFSCVGIESAVDQNTDHTWSSN